MKIIKKPKDMINKSDLMSGKYGTSLGPQWKYFLHSIMNNTNTTNNNSFQIQYNTEVIGIYSNIKNEWILKPDSSIIDEKELNCIIIEKKYPIYVFTNKNSLIGGCFIV